MVQGNDEHKELSLAPGETLSTVPGIPKLAIIICINIF